MKDSARRIDTEHGWKDLVRQKLSWIFCPKDKLTKYSNVFKHLDTDGDGQLSVAEVKLGFKEQLATEIDTEEKWNRAFGAMDNNGDGNVDYQEFISACVDVNEVITRENVEMMFHQMDLDGDGTLSVEELRALF